jgi:VCBS repeat-containing protein
VSASYTDPDVGDTHTFLIDTSTDATKGKVTNNRDGTFTYDPNGAFAYLAAGVTATDKFLYTVTDAAGAASTATVTMTITGQNDPPIAANISGSVLEYGPATTLTASYKDPDLADTHTFAVDTTGTKGKVTNNGNGTFTYNPNGAFLTLLAGTTATDSFKYSVTDGAGASSIAVATITIVGQDQLPVANNDSYNEISHTLLSVDAANGVLSNDVDPNGKTLTAVLVSPTSHGTLTLNKDGSFTYQSAASYVGTDNFTYKANDGVLSSNVASVQILVSGPPTQTLKGTPKDDNLSAFSAGSTYIIAEAGNDIIHGGSGSDWIDSGPGNDQMWGGAGADLFIIHGSDVVKSNTDRINDLNFAAGDQILLALR